MSVAPGAEPLVVVSGLPRSGTAMAMRMLEAGGMPVLVDDARPPDTANARGYYELAAVRAIRRDASFLAGARGRALKIVSPLLAALPEGWACDLILLRRPLVEVLASQAEMLRRSGDPGAREEADRLLDDALAKHLRWLDAWLAQRRGLRVLELWYAEVIAAPRHAAERLAAFLGRPLDVGRMAAVVEPALYRQRGAARAR